MRKTASKTKLYTIRVGDASPYEAGYLFGDLLYRLLSSKVSDEEHALEIVLSTLYRTELGFHVKPFFSGFNYVSLFAYEPLTDEEYEGVSPEELTDQEWQEFLSGLKDGILFD